MKSDKYNPGGEYGLDGRKVVDVSSGICPCGPSKKVRAAIRKAVREVCFPPDLYLSRLRKSLSSKLGIGGDSLLFANSIEELLHLISYVFRPRKVWAAGPMLDLHRVALSSSGAEVGSLHDKEGDFSPKDGAVPPAGEGTCLVFFSQPNRVTGRLADDVSIGKVVNSLGGEDTLVVVDESLIEFTDSPGNCRKAATGEGLIVLRSTANFYGLPGLGLAYVVSSPGLIERLEAVKHCQVNTLAAAAARAAIKDKTYLKTARKFIGEERKFLKDAINKTGDFVCRDSDSNVMLMGTKRSAKKICALFARKGLLMTVWDSGEEPGETFFRLSVMGHEKNIKFVRILREAVPDERASGVSAGD